MADYTWIQLLIVVAFVLVLCVPGMLLARAGGLLVHANPWLQLPLAATAGVASAAVPSSISVIAGTGMAGFALLFLGWTGLVAIVAYLTRARRAASAARERIPRSAAAAVALLSLMSACIAGVRGTSYVSDSSVHASIIEKLVHLPGVRFDELGLVPDGRPVDSAILPAWHHLLALVSWPLEHAGIAAMWSAGAAVALFVPWAGAALGWAAVRSHAGASLAAALTTSLALVPWREIPQTAAYLAYPGNMTIYVVLPALLAVLVESLGEETRARRAALRALALCVAVVALLHLTYLYYVALAGLGMALVLLVLRPASARRLLVPAGIVAGLSAAALAASIPFLSEAEAFNRGEDEDWGGERILKQWLAILDGRGNDIQPGYFLEAGGLALAGLLLAVLVVPLARGRHLGGVMLAVGPLLVLGTAARSDLVANFVSGLGSFPPIPRSYKVIPWVIVLVVLVSLLDRALQRRGRQGAAAPLAGVAIALGAAALAIAIPGRLLGRDAPAARTIDPVLPGWVFDAVLVVLALQLAGWAVLRVVRPHAAADDAAATDIDGESRGGRAATFAAWTLLVVAALATTRGVIGAAGARPDRLTHAAGLFGTQAFPDAAVSALEALEPGSRVFSEEGAGLRMAAVAPIYLPHVRKQSFSSTERREAYLDVVFRDHSDEARLDYLDDNEIELVLLPLRPEIRTELTPLLARVDGWQPIRRDGVLIGWRRR